MISVNRFVFKIFSFSFCLFLYNNFIYTSSTICVLILITFSLSIKKKKEYLINQVKLNWYGAKADDELSWENAKDWIFDSYTVCGGSWAETIGGLIRISKRFLINMESLVLNPDLVIHFSPKLARIGRVWERQRVILPLCLEICFSTRGLIQIWNYGAIVAVSPSPRVPNATRSVPLSD